MTTLLPVLVLAATLVAQSTSAPEAPAAPEFVEVGDTTYGAIYLYYAPAVGNRIQAYPSGTPLELIGTDVEGDGLTWHNVRAPDGAEGYIPVGDTIPSEPPTPGAPPVGGQGP